LPKKLPKETALFHKETAFSTIRREGAFRHSIPLEELFAPYSCHQAPEET
jgi:hypothetical protein